LWSNTCREGMNSCAAIRAEKMMMNVGQCLYRTFGLLCRSMFRKDSDSSGTKGSFSNVPSLLQVWLNE